MEVFLIKALQLILSISILVVLHEGGHFFFAKVFGIRVHRFSLFFDFWKGGKKKALKLGRWGKTDFVIGWLPFGGYVEIAGMVDESSNADAVAKEEASLAASSCDGGWCIGELPRGTLHLCYAPLGKWRTAHPTQGHHTRHVVQHGSQETRIPRR